MTQNKRQNAWQQFQTTKGRAKKVCFLSQICPYKVLVLIKNDVNFCIIACQLVFNSILEYTNFFGLKYLLWHTKYFINI